jgi:L-lactate dehydrogenase complex protein LldG
MYDLFKAKAEAVGSEVHRFKARAEALLFIEGLFLKEGIRESPGSYAVWADGPILKSVNTKALSKRIPGLTFKVTRESAKDARIGITQMDWGIANTGTVAQDSSSVEQRLAAALPWIHIALLHTSTIVPDLPALMSKMHPHKSSYIALTTGPSRTADIERVLAIGVHGPERLVVICIDEVEGDHS